jgi:hypothetical protein
MKVKQFLTQKTSELEGFLLFSGVTLAFFLYDLLARHKLEKFWFIFYGVYLVLTGLKLAYRRLMK